MIRNKELKYTMLKKEYSPDLLKFKTTKEVGKMDGVIGQERGIKALEFGLNINTSGYNLNFITFMTLYLWYRKNIILCKLCK